MFSFSDRSSAKELGVLHGQTDSRVPNTGAVVMCKLPLLCLPFTSSYSFPFLLQVAGIKTAISLKEKVCKIMNKTYGRCFRSFAIETLFWILVVGWFTHLASQQETRATSIPKQLSSSGEKKSSCVDLTTIFTGRVSKCPKNQGFSTSRWLTAWPHVHSPQHHPQPPEQSSPQLPFWLQQLLLASVLFIRINNDNTDTPCTIYVK